MEHLPKHISLANGNLCISCLDAIEVAQRYAGLRRIKPATFFGSNLWRLSSRLGIIESHTIELYERVTKAYRHYWPEPMGRFHCYEPEDQARPNRLLKSIAESFSVTTTPAKSEARSALLGFQLPPVSLYRRIKSLPKVSGSLHTLDDPNAESAAFYCVSVSSVNEQNRKWLGLDHRQKEGRVWLSAAEYTLLDPDEQDPCIAAGFPDSEASIDTIPEQAAVADWEALSLSVAIAHEGRLAGDLGTPLRKVSSHSVWMAAAERAATAIAFKPLIDALPSTAEYYQGVGRAAVLFDEEHQAEILAAAYHSGAVPLQSVPGAQMNWRRERSAHDVIFEMYLTGQTKEVLQTDAQALRKGGVL